MMLTSIHNDKVKFWLQLKQKKYRDFYKLFLIEDEHLINEALKYKMVREIITIDEKSKYEVPTYLVSNNIMQKISDQKSGAKIIAVTEFLEERDIRGNILVLDNIQDPGNLGTMIRSGVAFNFDTIVLSNTSVDLYNPKVVRSSEGMLFHINVIRCDISTFLNKLSKDYTIIGTLVTGGKNIKEIKFQKCAIVIGNEGRGLSKEVRALCDEFAYIKMNKRCESLNASICASILMYEVSNG